MHSPHLNLINLHWQIWGFFFSEHTLKGLYASVCSLNIILFTFVLILSLLFIPPMMTKVYFINPDISVGYFILYNRQLDQSLMHTKQHNTKSKCIYKQT